MVKILIDKKPDMINLKNERGETPLFIAVKINGKILFRKVNYWKLIYFRFVKNTGTESVIKCLISKGAKVNVKDKWEQTPLHVCVEKGKSLG